MTLARGAFAWAQLGGDSTKLVMVALGLDDADHLRVLAAFKEQDFEVALAEDKFAPAIKAKVAVAWGAAKFVVYGGPKPGPVGSVATSSGLTKFKLNTVVNQSSDVELVSLDGKSLAVAYTNFKAVFGTVPPPDQELTGEQLTAVKTLLDNDLVPYVDFAVWGPHGGRMMRKLKLHGVTFSSDGSLIPMEVNGPPGYDQWLGSYLCLRTALISWQAIDLGKLDAYSSMIGRYVSRYGSSAWLQIYQADVRCRSEHMERIRRRGEEEAAISRAAGHTHSMVASRPWDWVWAEAVKDLEFWRIELEEPALLALVRGQRSSSSSSGPSFPSVKRGAAAELGPPAKVARQHSVDGNIFVANRSGKRLCEDYNRGTCPSSATNSSVCPKSPYSVHQCSRCLDVKHTLVNCLRSDFPATKPGGKGKAKGKGKGSGKKNRWQY